MKFILERKNFLQFLFIFIILMNTRAFGAVIMLEDFEDATVNYTPSVAEFSDGGTDYFTSTANNGISAIVNIGNVQGANFFGAQDTDGDGGPAIVWLDFSIPINGFNNLNFSGLFAEDDAADLGEDWDTDSSVIVEYQIDGGGYTKLLSFEASGGNSAPQEDTDFDGVGDGITLSSNLTLFGKTISGTGNTLDIRITISGLNAGDEDIAFDNIEITGDVLAQEIDVLGNGVEIADGDTTPVASDNTDFGKVTECGTEILSKTFSITNSGITNLVLSGGPTVALTGDADFTVTTQPADTDLAPGEVTTFTIQFEPAATGMRSASVSISNNDSNENPYNFDIQGEGEQFVPEIYCPLNVTSECSVGWTTNITGEPLTDIPWINEFHYDDGDNAGGMDDADDNQGFEIAGPAGLDLSDFTLIEYKDATSMEINSLSNLVIDNEVNGFGALWYNEESLNVAGPQALALVWKGTHVVDFISYEGTITPTVGPAAGMTSTDVGVQESNATVEDNAIQKIGIGSKGDDFTWSGPSTHSRGSLNASQTMQTATDVTVSYSDTTNGTCPWVISRTWTATAQDACNNSISCIQTITVNDTTAPLAECKNVSVDPWASGGNVTITASQIDNGSKDECLTTNVTLSLNKDTFTCDDEGINVVILTVVDDCNNTNTCSAIVTVESCPEPGISISDPANTCNPEEGEVVTFTITITNTGGALLSNVSLEDSLCPGGMTTGPTALGGGNTADGLDVNEVWEYTCDYTVTAGSPDIITNIATVSADSTVGSVTNFAMATVCRTPTCGKGTQLIEIGFDEPAFADQLGTIDSTSIDSSNNWSYSFNLFNDFDGTEWNIATYAGRPATDLDDITITYQSRNDIPEEAGILKEWSSYNSTGAGRLTQHRSFEVTNENINITGLKYGGVFTITFASHLNVLASGNGAADRTRVRVNSLFTRTDAWEHGYVGYNTSTAPGGNWGADGFTGATGGGLWFIPQRNDNTVILHDKPLYEPAGYADKGTDFYGEGNRWIYAYGTAADDEVITTTNYTMHAGLASDATIQSIALTALQEWIETANPTNGYETGISTGISSIRDIQFVIAHPCIGLAKDAVVSPCTNGKSRVTFSLLISNYTELAVSDLSLKDDLSDWGTALDSVVSVNGSGLNANAAYNGTTDTELLVGGQTLDGNSSATITLVVDLAATNCTDKYTNVAEVCGRNGSFCTMDISHDGTDPDTGDDDPSNDNDPTIIQLVDTNPPVFLTVPANENLATCVVPDPAKTNDITYEDICSSVTASVASVSSTNNCTVTITNTWTIWDSCGNSNVTNQVISYIGNKDNFTVTCPDNIVTGCPADYVSLPHTLIVESECAYTISTNITTNTTDSCNTIETREYTVANACGTVTTCTQTISWTDTNAPTALCKNFTVDPTADGGTSTITINDINNGSTDDCGTVTLSLSKTNFTCEDAPGANVTLTVVDECNNTNTCIAQVFVENCDCVAITNSTINGVTNKLNACPDDELVFRVKGENLNTNTTIDFYYSTNANFESTNGTYTGSITISGSDGSTTTHPDSACPSILGIMYDACQGPGLDEADNEFLMLAAGSSGLAVNDILIDVPAGRGAHVGAIAAGGEGFLSDVDAATAITELLPSSGCLQTLGPGQSIPPNGVAAIFVSSDVARDYDFTELCADLGTVYILVSSINNASPRFSNTTPSSTVLGATPGCSLESYTYPDPQNTDGSFVQFGGPDNPGVTNAVINPVSTPAAGVTNLLPSCTSPPFDFKIETSSLTTTVTQAQCGDTWYYKGILSPTNTANCSGTAIDTTLTFEVMVVCPVASITGEVILCEGSNTSFEVDFSDYDTFPTSGFNITYSIDGVNQPVVTATNDPYTITCITEPGTIKLVSVVDNDGTRCMSWTGEVKVLEIVNQTINYSAVSVNQVCPSNSITLAASGDNLPEGSVLKWYYSTNANFNITAGEGTFLTNAAISFTKTTSTTSTAIWYINEIEADETGEFVEILGPPNTFLTGMVLVHINGSGDDVEWCEDLNASSTDANGYLLLSNADLPAIQGGPDAMAIYNGSCTDFQKDDPATTSNLIDVVVYGTSADPGLLAALGETNMVSEGGEGSSLQLNSNGVTYSTAGTTMGMDNSGGKASTSNVTQTVTTSPGTIANVTTNFGTNFCNNTIYFQGILNPTNICPNNTSVETTSVLQVTMDANPPVIVNYPDDCTLPCNTMPTTATTNDITVTESCDFTITVESNVVATACMIYITNSWTVVDACNNSNSVTQSINVVTSSTPPAITCPPDTTNEYYAFVSAPQIESVTTTDTDCVYSITVTLLSESQNNGTGCKGSPLIITRVYHAEDACGLTNVCTQVLTVEDTTPPVFTNIPPNITIDCHESTAPTNTGQASGINDCP